MKFGDEIVKLFAEIDFVAAACLSIGLILCVVEIYHSNRGLFAGLGLALLVLGFVFRLTSDGSAAMFFVLTLICAAILLTAYLIMIRHSRYNWIIQTPNIEGGPTAHDPEPDATKDYYFLLGLSGLTLTELNPNGEININNTPISARSAEGSIAENVRVKVVEVEGNRIVVKPDDPAV